MTIKNIQTSHLVHDLKNPVNIIETGAKSLLDKQDRYGSLNPKQEKVIRRILRNALKIRNLANSMLEVDMAAMGIIRVSDCTLSGILKVAFVEVFDLIDPVVSDALEEAADVETFRNISKSFESHSFSVRFRSNESGRIETEHPIPALFPASTCEIHSPQKFF